jgi:hypothetical protein
VDEDPVFRLQAVLALELGSRAELAAFFLEDLLLPDPDRVDTSATQPPTGAGAP